MLCFSLITLLALSNVSHKEERFMSAIFPQFAITFSFFIMQLGSLIDRITGVLGVSDVKVLGFKPFKAASGIVCRGFFLLLIFKEIKQVVPQYITDKDIYTYLHGRNQNVLDYSSFIANKTNDFGGFDQIESVYALNKFSTPITTYAHTNEGEKVTVLTQTF